MGAALTPTIPNSARTLLVQWANQQDAWVRHLVSEVLTSSTPVSDSYLDEVYKLFLIEKGLIAGEPVTIANLTASGGTKEEIEPLCLTRLDGLENVNAITEGQGIDFNAKLTIVYGQNASGKTGYVRVLKTAAAVRKVEKVLPNVSAVKKPVGPPTASISFRLGANESKVQWTNESGLVPFTRIDVFDSGATNVHVDQDLNYVYTPAELARFPRTQKGLEGIRTRLEASIAEATKNANPYTSLFVRGTRVYTVVESLGASSDVAAIRELATVEDAEAQDAEPLKIEIEALKSGNPELQIRAATELKQRVEAVGKAVTTLSGIDANAYSMAVETAAAANDRYEAVTRDSFAGLPIPGLLQDEWRKFIQAGEDYLQTTEQNDAYPASGASCIYCQQPLANPAIELLKKYRDFCNNTFRSELTEAQNRVDSIVAPLRSALNFLDLQRQLGDLLNAVPQLASIERELLKAILAAGEQAVSAMERRQPMQWPPEGHSVETGRTILKRLWEQNTEVLTDLTGKKDEREKALREKEARLADIEARVKLAQLLPDIEKFVASAKWADRARIHQNKFPTLLRSLTEASKLASEDLLNRDFETLFKEECRLLRAPEVTLQFPGRGGQVMRKKAVASEYRCSEVLSEGEQKVTALADFLAESSLKPPAPVIFDDPINSLDYIRMSEVVNRIVKLTDTRQVIVFTHNIWFATELLSRFETQKNDCSYYDVSREGERIGVVSKGTHPRSDTVSNLRKRINATLQLAEKQTGELRQVLVEKAYELLRSLCEVIVEAELLAGVTTRYQPNVRMTVLPQIKGNALQAATEAICPIFEDCCRYIASHSQPLETLNVRPTLETFKADLQKVIAARDAYLGA